MSKHNYLDIIFVCCLAFAVQGCKRVNNFETFYREAPYVSEIKLESYKFSSSFETCSTPPDVVKLSAGISKDDVVKIGQKGFVPFGESNFILTGHEVPENLFTFARHIGACVVLISEKVSGTNQQMSPVFTPVGTMYATTSHDRTEYNVVYFAKRTYPIGIITADLPDTVRSALATNSGAYVKAVVDGSRGFRADIVPEDVVLAVNGLPVSNAKTYNETIRRLLNDEKIDFSILRKGKKINILIYP